MANQATETATPKRQLFAAFRIKGYGWFWASMFWSSSGQSGRMLAQGWLILQITDADSAPLWLGILAAVRSIGSTLLSPFGGIIIDRIDRRYLLVVMQIFNMATSLVLGVLVATDWIQLWHVVVISLTQGFVMAVSMPARNAMTFDLAGRDALMNAMSANFLASDVMRIVRPVIAGLITDHFGIEGAFFFLASSFIVATFCVLRLPATPISPRARRASVWSSLGEGVRYASRNPNMRVLMVMDLLMSLFAYSATLMLPVFARDHLGLGATGLGILMSGMGIGSLSMSILIASSSRIRPTHIRFLLAALGYSAMVAGWASSPWVALALVFLVLNGVASGWFNTLSSAMIQVAAAEEYRARMIGLQGLTWGATSLGGLTTGGLAMLLGVPLALVSLAALPGSLAVWYLVTGRKFTTSR